MAMQDEHFASLYDADSDWPLTQGGWLSYSDSQEAIPLEQVPDPDRELELQSQFEREEEEEEDPIQDQELSLEDELEQEEEEELEQEDELGTRGQRQKTQRRKAGTAKEESTIGHRLPVFFQPPSEAQSLHSLRKVHLERLGQLLRRLLVRRDLQTAAQIFELLFDAKETSEEFIWKISLEFLYSLETYEGESVGFLSWLFSKSRYHKQAILLELVLYQMRCGKIQEAELSLRTYITVAPYNKDPLIQGYAGMIKMLLLEKAEMDERKTLWHIYGRWDVKELNTSPISAKQNVHLSPWELAFQQNANTVAWNKNPESVSVGDGSVLNSEKYGPSSWAHGDPGKTLTDTPPEDLYEWNLDDVQDREGGTDDPDFPLPPSVPISQSLAPDRLRQDAINHLEKSLELEPANDEFLQALVDVRLGFLDYSNFDRSQLSKAAPELQEAIVDMKVYLRRHLRRHESLKALHILASLEAIVGSKEERIRLLQEILRIDPGASTRAVIQPLVQYYWQRLTPEVAQLVTEIEKIQDDHDDGDEDDDAYDDDDSDYSEDDHDSVDEEGDSDRRRRHRRRRRHTMTFEEENLEVSKFEALLDEYGPDDPYSPYLLDVVENLAFLGRDTNMGKFEGVDREYEFFDAAGDGACETKRRLFAWPGRMKMPEKKKRDEEEDQGEEGEEKKKKKKKKERPLSMNAALFDNPPFKSHTMKRTLTDGATIEQIPLHQFLKPTKDDLHDGSGGDEDDGEDPELLTPGTHIGTLRIIEKLNRHQPPVEPFRPILEMLLQRAEFGVLTQWEEEELVRICNLFCFCCLYCRRQTRLEALWRTHLRWQKQGKSRMVSTCFEQYPPRDRPYWFEKLAAILTRPE